MADLTRIISIIVLAAEDIKGMLEGPKREKFGRDSEIDTGQYQQIYQWLTPGNINCARPEPVK